MKLTIGQLYDAVNEAIGKGIPLSYPVTFQGNEKGELDNVESDEFTHTVETGHVFAAFDNAQSFVIDCAITNWES